MVCTLLFIIQSRIHASLAVSIINSSDTEIKTFLIIKSPSFFFTVISITKFVIREIIALRIKRRPFLKRNIQYETSGVEPVNATSWLFVLLIVAHISNIVKQKKSTHLATGALQEEK